MGTITPSSRFLSKKMIRKIDFTKAAVIVEFGPGNGAITKHILKNLSPKAILICFEINDNFYHQLKALKHPQLIVVKASAEKIEEELKKINITKVNYVISSLPLTIIPDMISNEILRKSYQVLDCQGTFIQYQYSLTYYNTLKNVFRESISLDFQMLNLPPAFIYHCKKVG
ncbi:class I SAM-dependent methyltransferase [Polaribacter sp.]|uniref:class I SAM-dependent methyltransferase n=1 Tax=Polaribacter sp. TaxID=1920175 RepID=UPI003F6D9103